MPRVKDLRVTRNPMPAFQLLQRQPTNTPADAAYLLAHTFADGQGFPPSYINFATELGWGRLCGLFLVYVPLGYYPDSWLIQSPRIRRFMTEFYEEVEYDPFLVEPDGYVGIERALIPFAMSENGEYLAWNADHRNTTGEFPIYVIAARMGGIRYGAENLYQFVDNCTDAVAVKGMLGPGYEALPGIFEPLTLVNTY